MADITILSLNCRQWSRDRDKSSAWYWRKRMERVAETIEKCSPDVLCLQELTYPATKYIPKGYKRVTHGFSHSIWMRRGLDNAKPKGWRIHMDYITIWQDTINSSGALEFRPIRIINVHSRWNEWIIRKVTKQINGKIKPFTIVVGDFNAEAEKYAKMGIKMRNRPIHTDTFQNPTKPEQHGEIDLCFRTDMVRIKTMQIASNELMSDHKPILIIADVW